MDIKLPDMESALWVKDALAAAAGSLLGLKAIPGSSFKEKLFNLLCGFLMAVYAAPALSVWVGITSEVARAGMIFGTGAAGLVLFGSLIDGIRATPLGPFITGFLAFFTSSRGVPPSDDNKGA